MPWATDGEERTTGLDQVRSRCVPIYATIADGLPPWAREEIDSICRKFLWTGTEGSVRGKCMVAWPVVCRPTDLGGLGVPDLHLTGIALQARWLWLRHTDETRVWADLPLSTSREVRAFFDMSTFTVIGNGRSTSFWTGRWLMGHAIKDIAPSLLHFISRRDIVNTTVAAGMQARAWVRQISRGITVPAMREYLNVWDMVS